MALVRRYQALRLALLEDLSLAGERARGGDRPGRARGRGVGRACWSAIGTLAADPVAAAHPDLGRRVPAGVGDRAGRPPARRHHRLDAAAARRAQASRCAIRDGTEMPAAPARRLAVSFDRRALHLSGRAPARARRDVSFERAARHRPWRWSDRRAPARRRSPICCCASGTRTKARSALTAWICAISRSTGCAGASRWWRRTPICSTTRWRPTSGSPGPEADAEHVAPRRRAGGAGGFRRRPARGARDARSASAACSSPAGSGSASRSRARS